MSISREDVDAGLVDLSEDVDPDAGPIGPIHPGLTLRDFMDDYSLSASALARALHVPTNRIAAILNGTRGITGETALRLGRHFGTSPQFWMNLQAHYELDVAKSKYGNRIAQEIAPAEIKHAA
jgi:addiction module HigA family antidote